MRTATLALLASLCMVPSAFAADITYTVTTTGSGSLNGVSFSNSLVTVNLTGDTSQVNYSNYQGETLYTNFGSGTISVVGAGSEAVSNWLVFTQYYPATYQGLESIGGFIEVDGNIHLTEVNPTVDLYNLASDTAPFVGAPVDYIGDPTTVGGTSDDGTIDLTTIGDISFSAELGSGSITLAGNGNVGATPEPSSLALLGTGMFGLAGAVRRRFKR